MHAADHESFDGMATDYFQKPDPRARALIGFKAPQALKDKILGLLVMWKIRAEVEGELALASTKFKSTEEREKAEEAHRAMLKAMDFSYACNRLMNVATDEALAEALNQIGFESPPGTDAELEKAKAAFLKLAKSRK